MTQDFWTQERVDTTVRMHLEGFFPTEIAKTIGAETRDMVCGKLRRLRKSGVIKPAKRVSRTGTLAKRPMRKRLILPAAAQQVAPPPPIAKPLGERAAILSLVPKDGCRWITEIFAPGCGDDAIMCGDFQQKGSAFCAHHATQARRPATAKVHQSGWRNVVKQAIYYAERA